RFSRDWSSDVCSSDLRLVTATKIRCPGRDKTWLFIKQCPQIGDEGLGTLVDRHVNRGPEFTGVNVLVNQGGKHMHHERCLGLEKIGRASCRERVWMAV